jgi:Holliday junction resolvasome RuvABC DNA-binding subunit
VLSGVDSRDLVIAVQRGDVARLTAIPGIGKKTAERIVLELRDRLAQLARAVRGIRRRRVEGERLRATCCRRCRTSAIIDRRPTRRSTAS